MHKLLKPFLFPALLTTLLLAGCGDSTLSSPNHSPDSSNQDTHDSTADTDSTTHDTTDYQDILEDIEDIEDIEDTHPDTSEPEPDIAEPELDVSEPEPDIAEPEPEPPSWACTTVPCTAVDTTTTLAKMKAIDACAFELALEKPLTDGTQLADQLLDRLQSEGIGQRVTLTDVLGSLNRSGQSGLSSANNTRLAGLNATGFRWNSGDINVDYWYPQGITGSSDATANGLVNGRKLIMVAWYHKTDERPTRGARVSLADITDPNNITYRHLLLVDPISTPSGPNFKAAEYDGGNALHAGGIVWYGDYLYVADTSRGLRIYDLSRIFKPNKVDAATRIGISAGRSDAHTYAFAVPRIARFRLTKDSCPTRFSFVGLDRTTTPPTLTTGEYFADHHNGRVVTWPLDSTTHLLETRRGTTRAAAASVIGQTRVQGALTVGQDYYFSASSQNGSYGRLYTNRPGQNSRSVTWIAGTEDLYHDRQTGRIWSPAEHPGARDVVSIPRANIQ